MVINFAQEVGKIITDPASRGIGAGVNQKQQTKATDTTSKDKQALSNTSFALFTVNGGFGSAFNKGLNNKPVTATTPSSGTMRRSIESPLPAERLANEIFGNKKNYVSTLVDEMLDATVNKKIRDEIKKGKLSLKTSKLATTYATAVAYYKKLYDGSIIMNQLRNKTEKNISKLINQSINDKVAAWQKKLPNWQRTLLSKSKLMSSLTNNVNEEVRRAIGSIFTDKMISGINDSIINNLKKINTNISTTITTKFKDEIEKDIKLRSAVQEKITQFMELKRQYETKIYNAIQAFKNKIAEVISNFTKKLVSTLTDSIKSLTPKAITGAVKI